ncbi:hypothetical protein DAPPUDRAFT_110430 [Daphnia pulex]|uniref:Peptidase S1 domain-containing protein n=1 Tax=Daphnia pulex TaxID=6669 RepID=E9H689_DAPPU|nr:hypothetical protein DAPPUDRAFT_110430 [Daphnia pulex]|eukprot:EFX72770.1 hypothetical protein DAPPUDRAFT_110430 [Daphnia pulex]
MASRYSQLFVLVLSVFLFLLPISCSHATGFFCPNSEAVSDYTFIYFPFSTQINLFVLTQYGRHLNELLSRNDLVFSGTVGNITSGGRLIIIRIKSVFKGEWKTPSITLLASEQLESSSPEFQPQKEDTSHWSMPQRSLAGCFSYGPTELRQRDSRVFFVRAHGSSAVLGTHIQITKFILIKLRNSTKIDNFNIGTPALPINRGLIAQASHNSSGTPFTCVANARKPMICSGTPISRVSFAGYIGPYSSCSISYSMFIPFS